MKLQAYFARNMRLTSSMRSPCVSHVEWLKPVVRADSCVYSGTGFSVIRTAAGIVIQPPGQTEHRYKRQSRHPTLAVLFEFFRLKYLNTQRTTTSNMDGSDNRLFRFSKPEWLNNSTVRNSGVYAAGALVTLPICHFTASLVTHH